MDIDWAWHGDSIAAGYYENRFYRIRVNLVRKNPVYRTCVDYLL